MSIKIDTFLTLSKSPNSLQSNNFDGHPLANFDTSSVSRGLCDRTAGPTKDMIMKKLINGLSRTTLLALLTALAAGCQALTYDGPNGERFARSSLGSTTSISSLTVESGTNGLRRVELRGYQNDSTQALSTVTEAAVRAALQGVK